MLITERTAPVPVPVEPPAKKPQPVTPPSRNAPAQKPKVVAVPLTPMKLPPTIPIKERSVSTEDKRPFCDGLFY